MDVLISNCLLSSSICQMIIVMIFKYFHNLFLRLPRGQQIHYCRLFNYNSRDFIQPKEHYMHFFQRRTIFFTYTFLFAVFLYLSQDMKCRYLAHCCSYQMTIDKNLAISEHFKPLVRLDLDKTVVPLSSVTSLWETTKIEEISSVSWCSHSLCISQSESFLLGFPSYWNASNISDIMMWFKFHLIPLHLQLVLQCD